MGGETVMGDESGVTEFFLFPLYLSLSSGRMPASPIWKKEKD
jgi:hypothetical protein